MKSKTSVTKTPLYKTHLTKFHESLKSNESLDVVDGVLRGQSRMLGFGVCRSNNPNQIGQLKELTTRYINKSYWV